MAYTKTNWVSGETPLSASNMNHIEDGIDDLNTTMDKFLHVEQYSQVTTVNYPIAPGDNTYYIPFGNIPKGYTAVGVVGINTSGTGSSKVRLRGFCLSDKRVVVKLRSEEENYDLVGMTIAADVLFVKDGSI